MKKIENNFAVTGFVGKDAEIRQFTNASVARFSLAVSRQEKNISVKREQSGACSGSAKRRKCRESNGKETNRVSAFMGVEAWRKNEHTESFDLLTKGALITVEGFFKPEEWNDKDGVRHNRIVMVATKFYAAPDKEEAPAEKPAEKKTKGKK